MDEDDKGQPEANTRDTFFEQLLTVRMPTAGPAVPLPSLRDAPAEGNTRRHSAPPAHSAEQQIEQIEQMPTIRTRATTPPAAHQAGQIEQIEQMPTMRVRATMPPVSAPADSPAVPYSAEAPSPATARQRLSGAPGIAEAPAYPAIAAVPTIPSGILPPPPAGHSRRTHTPRARKRRTVVLAAFGVLLVVVALVPMLYQLSSSSVSAGHSSGYLRGINPPPGWHPQDWAPIARQQAELRYVNQLIAHMSLDQEIGQMIMLGFLETEMDPTLAYTIKQFHLGSVVLYAWNITGADQVKQLTTQIQAEGDLPLFIATDQEGGSVNRLQAVDGPLPGAGQIGATGNPDVARQRGAEDAQSLYDIGVNVNFAPVVDVANTSLGDLGGRTFGSTPDQVTKMAGAYLSGLQASGHVIGTLKHFPGLGDVPADPHQTLYTLDRSKQDLERIDWAPYKSLIASGQVQMIMSTHVVLSAIDPTLPASLSKPVLTGILRDELGFQGVIVTDGIYMAGLTSHYSFDQIILDAVEAGNDIICSTYSIASTAETVRVLKEAVQNGTIPKSRIDDSVRRILLLKLHYGVLTLPQG
ncbi:MAG TPA: glycoside hydrolase family 3 N-terminal domain-containing protein [Ktedonobacterales bacterium]